MSVVLAALTALAVIVIVGAILDACERRRNLAALPRAEREQLERWKHQRAEARGRMLGVALGAGFWLLLLILILGVSNAFSAFMLWFVGAALCAIAKDNIK